MPVANQLRKKKLVWNLRNEMVSCQFQYVALVSTSKGQQNKRKWL